MAKKSCKSVISFICFFIISFSTISVSAQVCGTTGTFKPNSLYDNNLRLILSTLASNVTAHGGYFNGSMGLDPDRVYAMGMCSPVATPDVCSQCIEATSDGLLQNCLNETEAFFWSGEDTLCLVRYSNRSFTGLLVLAPRGAVYNTGNLTTNQTLFDSVWRNLTLGMIDGTTSSSSSGVNNSSRYYANDVAPVPDFGNISAMMQCTPDVSSEDCSSCLRTNVFDYETCCRGHLGGVISRLLRLRISIHSVYFSVYFVSFGLVN